MNFKALGQKIDLEEDEYRELIELFAESGTADYQRLQSALAVCDADQVMRYAHTIKGASGNLGLSDMSELAQTIEQKARSRQMDNLTEIVRALGTHFEHIESCVRG